MVTKNAEIRNDILGFLVDPFKIDCGCIPKSELKIVENYNLEDDVKHMSSCGLNSPGKVNCYIIGKNDKDVSRFCEGFETV